jgi:hypothetical protein
MGSSAPGDHQERYQLRDPMHGRMARKLTKGTDRTMLLGHKPAWLRAYDPQ